MAQSDLTIQNQSFPSFRSDLNDALTALNTTQSGTSRPSSAVAGTIWLDTTNASSPTLKLYDGGDDISLATLDYSANTVNWLDSTVSADLVNDLSPQLGGMLDVNGNAIGNGTEELIKFSETASAVNEITVTNSATGNAPEISVTGDDTNIDFKLTPKGTGKLVLDGLNFPTADGTTGQFLKTDGSGNLSFAEAGGGGKVLQVVSALKTDTFSASVTAGSSTAVTDLSITHTLSNSSNKLLLMAYFGAAASADQIMPIGIALADDGTLIGIGDAASSRTRVGAGGAVTGTGGGYVVSMPHIHLLYSPGDTSSHTYTVNIINVDTATRTLYVNRTLDVDDNAGFPRSVSAITLMEISA